MKKYFDCILLTIFLVTLSGCAPFFAWLNKDKEISASAVEDSDSCHEIPKLKWQIYTKSTATNDELVLADKLSVAAKVDITKLKAVADVGGSIAAGLTSELSNIVNQNVTQESRVTEKFWEQDLTYRQTLCFLHSLVSNKNYTPDQKNKIVTEILALSEARREYTFHYEIEKKNGNLQ